MGLDDFLIIPLIKRVKNMETKVGIRNGVMFGGIEGIDLRSLANDELALGLRERDTCSKNNR
jgi:hypothetical protein